MERLKGSDGRFIRRTELLNTWQDIDGFNPRRYPTKLLREVQEIINNVVDQGAEYGPEHAAALNEVQAKILETGLSPEDKASLLVSSTKDIVNRDNRTPEADEAYHYVRHELLPHVLGDSFYVRAGKEIATALEDGEPLTKADIVSDYVDADRFGTLSTVSPAVRSQILKRLNEFNLTKYDRPSGEYASEAEIDAETFIKYGKVKKAAEYLSTGYIEVARLMSRIDKSAGERIESMQDLLGKYKKHNEERKIDTVKVDTKSDNLRILPFNELRLGHQDGEAGLELVDRTVDLVKQLDEDKQPQVVLLTNMVQSDFAHHQAKKRATLVGNVNTEGDQYRAANVVLDRVKELGKPVIVSLGPDDHAMAYDAVQDIVREMRGYLKVGGKENFISYYETNNLIQDEAFQTHLKFYIEHVIPLCYRMGRRLRTKDEMADSGSDIEYSEYFAIYNHIVHGMDLPKGIDPAVVADAGEWRDGLVFVDDFDLEADTEGGAKRVAYRHNMAFSAETLSQNHMMPVMRILGGLAANGANLPDILMTGRQQQLFYLNGGLTLPGLWDTESSLNSKQIYATAPGDASRRSNIMRGVPAKPTIDMYEETDDGRKRHHIISKEILDKADSIPRTALFELCDMQIGSPSARPDLQIMYLSRMLETAREMPIAIQVAGDIIHGHLYPDFPEESQAIGLVSLKSQKIHVRQILNGVFDVSDPIIRDLVNNIVDIVVQPGNHDKIMKPRFPNNLDDNIDYLVTDFKHIVDRDGEPTKVRNEAVFEEAGTPVGTWMARTHLGAYSILTAHYHMRKGFGGGSGFPVNDAYNRVRRLAQKSPDLVWGAHWHNTQVATFGNTVSVVGGAMAGQTNFEDFGGMRSVPAGTVVYLGGGEPMTVEFISAKTLYKGGVKYGEFTPERLEEEGYRDDPDFDPAKHGPYSLDSLPKSALNKKLFKLRREASQLADHMAVTENPNRYDENGNPVSETLNDITRRAYEIAAKKLAK